MPVLWPEPGIQVHLTLPVRTSRRLVGVCRVRLGSALADAIANAEGANVPGSIPNRANNPGDLKLGDIGYGTLAAAGGQQITVFPSLAAGMAALEHQISLIASGQSKAGYPAGGSIADIAAVYTGGSGTSWAQNVANFLGLTPESSFASAAGLSAPASSEASSEDTSGDGITVAPWMWLVAGAAVLYLIL